jgi:hypothetical protein
MSDQQAFEQLKEFFENRPACALACDSLRKNVEIGVTINDNVHCTFFKVGEKPRFERREPVKADVIFFISPDAVQTLVASETDDVGELGILVAKMYLTGTIKIKVVGSMISLLTNGYLGVVKSGGMSFARFLGSHGISGLGKIKDVIEKIRKQK